MAKPSADVTKTDGNTGVVRPGAAGILCIIAPSEKGQMVPASYSKDKDALAEYGAGPLAELGALALSRTKKNVVLCRVASTDGVVGALVVTTPGTSVITVDAASLPLDDYLAAGVRFKKGGTVGTVGAVYQYTLDGLSWSPAQGIALGAANSITIPGSGITFDLAAGTVLTGTKAVAPATGPSIDNADLATALESLRVSRLRFESVLVDGEGNPTRFATLALWRNARDAEGRYYSMLLNSRFMDPDAETEAAYLADIGSEFAASADIGLIVGFDGFDAVSPLTGRTHRRPAAANIAFEGMSVPISVDVARTANGPNVGVSITDPNGNPKYHNEENFDGADDQRFSTLRTFNLLDGVYITNANLFSPSGSDYVYWQHIRVMNRACEITKQMLTQKLSQGVNKVTAKREDGSTYVRIAETDAVEIELDITRALKAELGPHSSDCGFILSRTDDIGSNAGAVIHGDTWLQALAYIKKFVVEAHFVRTIPAGVAAAA